MALGWQCGTSSHTIFDTPSFTHHFVTHHLSHTIFHIPLCHTPSFTHNFVTHHLSPNHLSHTTSSHTIFHHTIFHTQLCHTPSFATPSFTHHFVTHHLSHTQRCHTLSFTHTHHLSHITLSHTIFHIRLCPTQLFLLLDPSPPPLSFLPYPSRYNICCSVLEEVDLWGYPVL